MRSSLFLTLFLGAAAVQGQQPRVAVPSDPITLIVEALRTHSVVAFSDPHGHPELQAFELAVVRDTRVRSVIDDIVVESGNARFQAVMDRYIGGEAVPYEELHHVWHDTTQTQNIGPKDGTVPELYRVVRDLNASATPPLRKLRVLLGDPPVDWSVVRTAQDHRKWIEQRELHAAAVIEREVLARHHHALVVYGEQHLQRRNLAANYSTEGLAATVGSGIEKAAPGQLFSLWWLTDEKAPPAEVANWPSPSAALVRGTTLGMLDYTAFQESPPTRATIINGEIVPLPRSEWRNLRMEEQFDAVLKIDKVTAVPQTPPTRSFDVCADRDWVTEWIRRLTLPSGPSGGGPVSPTVQRLRNQCGL